jgi:3'-5' exoribonuclease
MEAFEPTSDPQEAFNNLKVMAKEHGKPCLHVANRLLNTPEFKKWSASSRKDKHHYGTGQLAIHTNEVAILCKSVGELYAGRHPDSIDLQELFLAALFHDSGKICDHKHSHIYYKQTDPNSAIDEWTGTDHRRLIHHVSRSAIMWHDAAQSHPELFETYHDKVLHAILAHHGRREWGSPVAPKTRTAWILHYCDALSARIYDADTSDIVHAVNP